MSDVIFTTVEAAKVKQKTTIGLFGGNKRECANPLSGVAGTKYAILGR